MNRPKTRLEEIGERCLQVVRDHANDREPTPELLAEFAWALDLGVEIVLTRTEPEAVPAEPDVGASDVSERRRGP